MYGIAREKKELYEKEIMLLMPVAVAVVVADSVGSIFIFTMIIKQTS